VAGETKGQAQMGVSGTALLASLTRDVRIDRHALAAPRPGLDQATGLMTQDERPGQHGVSDPRLGVPVEIGTADAHRSHTDEFVSPIGEGLRLVYEAEVARSVQPQ
jgi:hypothetical protein